MSAGLAPHLEVLLGLGSCFHRRHVALLHLRQAVKKNAHFWKEPQDRLDVVHVSTRNHVLRYDHPQGVPFRAIDLGGHLVETRGVALVAHQQLSGRMGFEFGSRLRPLRLLKCLQGTVEQARKLPVSVSDEGLDSVCQPQRGGIVHGRGQPLSKDLSLGHHLL